jgi:hypothetical protein
MLTILVAKKETFQPLYLYIGFLAVEYSLGQRRGPRKAYSQP